MKNNIKNIVVTAAFSLFLAFFFVLCIVHEPVAISESERRPLAQMPENITWEGIVDKTVIDGFEDYSVDQFPFREFFRSVKARFQLNVLNLKENNGYAVEDGYIAKIEQDFNSTFVNDALKTLSKIYDRYVKDNGGNVYLTLIPDKNYFFAEKYGYLSPDYEALIEKTVAALPEAEYVDLFSVLELEDYYKADTHWSQDKLDGVVKALAEAMGCSDRLSGEYKYNTLSPFYGVYHSQSALYPEAEELVYLTNDILDACTVYDYETGKTSTIYDMEKFKGSDGYDFYLSGTRALIRIDNPNATTDKELIIFRDSYGSSLAPLLAEGYRSIYLVDIRYVEPSMLGMFIKFEGKDVLFAYSALILNSNTFRTLK